MITLTILVIIMVLLIIAAIVAASIGGALFMIIFGDLIVCALVIGFIIKKWIERKKKK